MAKLTRFCYELFDFITSKIKEVYQLKTPFNNILIQMRLNASLCKS